MEKFRILIADDSEMIQELIRSVLDKLGNFDISEARDGKQALDIIEKGIKEGKPIQLGLLDWNMPNMTGIEVLNKVMVKENVSIPEFIMVTADREQKSVKEAFKAGAIDYIPKPFSAHMFQRKIEKYLAKKKSA